MALPCKDLPSDNDLTLLQLFRLLYNLVSTLYLTCAIHAWYYEYNQPYTQYGFTLA